MEFVLPVTIALAFFAVWLWISGSNATQVARVGAILLLLTGCGFSAWKVADSPSDWSLVEGGAIGAFACGLLIAAAPRPPGFRMLLDHGRLRAGGAIAVSIVCVMGRVAPDILGRLGSILSPYSFIAASVCIAITARARSPLSSISGWITLVSITAIGFIPGQGGDKGALAVLALVWIVVLLDPRVRWRVRFAIAIFATLVSAPLVSLTVESLGYESLAEFVDVRVSRRESNVEQTRILGTISDGGRLALWQESVDRLSQSPIAGMPLGSFRDDFAHDEHNGVIFMASRTGMVGVAWLAIFSPLAVAVLSTIAKTKDCWVSVMLWGGPFIVYIAWSDILSTPFWISFLSLSALAVLPDPWSLPVNSRLAGRWTTPTHLRESDLHRRNQIHSIAIRSAEHSRRRSRRSFVRLTRRIVASLV